jgi:hypothetical protein
MEFFKTIESVSGAQSLYDYAQGQLDATLPYLPAIPPGGCKKILQTNDLAVTTTPREVALLGSPHCATSQIAISMEPQATWMQLRSQNNYEHR